MVPGPLRIANAPMAVDRRPELRERPLWHAAGMRWAGMRRARLKARGTVKFFKADKGWGGDQLQRGTGGRDVFVHFAVIEADGYRAFDAGDIVDLEYIAAQQDSFDYVATGARRVEAGPAPTLRRMGQRVVIAPHDTPDTPLTPRKRR